MVNADDVLEAYPALGAALVAALGAIGYVVPTVVFGRPVEPLPTIAFAVGFALVYLGGKLLRRRFPELP